MATKLNPYLNFRGRAREAMEFYRSVFGGELSMNTFAELGMEVADDERDQVMHSQLSGGAVEFMAADVPGHMPFTPGSSISMSLFGASEDGEQLSGFFAKLSDGGQVTAPLMAAPWGDRFGMCVDRFGIAWMVNISGTG